MNDNVFIGYEGEDGQVNAQIVENNADHYVLLTGSIDHSHYVEALIAHELAHAALRHTTNSKLTVDYTVLAIGTLYLITQDVFIACLVGLLSGCGLVAPIRQQEEFDADQKAAEIVGPDKVVETLELIKRTSPQSKFIQSIFGSHPPIDERIKHIRAVFPQD